MDVFKPIIWKRTQFRPTIASSAARQRCTAVEGHIVFPDDHLSRNAVRKSAVEPELWAEEPACKFMVFEAFLLKSNEGTSY